MQYIASLEVQLVRRSVAEDPGYEPWQANQRIQLWSKPSFLYAPQHTLKVNFTS